MPVTKYFKTSLYESSSKGIQEQCHRWHTLNPHVICYFASLLTTGLQHWKTNVWERRLIRWNSLSIQESSMHTFNHNDFPSLHSSTLLCPQGNSWPRITGTNLCINIPQGARALQQCVYVLVVITNSYQHQWGTFGLSTVVLFSFDFEPKKRKKKLWGKHIIFKTSTSGSCFQFSQVIHPSQSAIINSHHQSFRRRKDLILMKMQTIF